MILWQIKSSIMKKNHTVATNSSQKLAYSTKFSEFSIDATLRQKPLRNQKSQPFQFKMTCKLTNST